MNHEHPTTLEEIIADIMLEESEPSHEALARWSKRYPEHREALARHFATWAIQEELPDEPPVDEARAGARMVSQAMNILYRQRAARPAPAGATQPSRLIETLKACGLSLEEFAARTGLDESMVIKLDRRRVRYASIPRKCLERISVALGRAVELVQAMLAGEPVPVGANKSHGKPEVKTEDFLDAVRASDLSDEAQSDWIAAVAEESSKGGSQ